MNIEGINLALSGKYSDFSDNVKGELLNKLSQHPDCIAYAGEVDKIQQMKTAFAEINKIEV